MCCTPKGVDVDPSGSEGSVRGADENSKRYLTSEELVNALASLSQDKLGAGKGAAATKGVSINISVIETILLETEDQMPARRSSVGRKATGFVSKDEVESALAKTHFSTDQDSPSGGRSKTRKGTGFVTKEKLLEVLGNDSDEEDDDAVDPKAKDAKSAVSPSTATSAASDRCKARKGTGFVSKSKLKKVLDVVGDGDGDE